MKDRAKRFWHLAQWQLAEARHQRVLWVLGAVAAGVAVSGGALGSFNFGQAEPRFFLHLARLALAVTGTLVSALVAPVLVQSGVRTRVAQVMFARGVRRWEWIAASGLALAVVLAWLAVAVAAGLTGLLLARGHGGSLGVVRLLAADLGPLLVVGGWAAFFSAVFAQSTPASLSTVALAVALVLAPVVDHMVQRSEGVLRAAWWLLDRLLPDFAALATSSPAIWMGSVAGHVVLLGVAAAVVFSSREL